MKTSRKTLDAMLEMSLGVDERIEALRDAQASMWTIHNELLLAETEAKCRHLERKASRTLMRIEALLPKASD
jgi:hypothetical protein